VYAFDISSLTWMNSGRPVYRAGAGSSYRGMVNAPRPLAAPGTFCRAPPTDSQTAGGYNTQWPNGYVLASTAASGATWGSQNAPVYASASFGCPAGSYSSSLATLACSAGSGWDWASFAAPACAACAAPGGRYCPPNGLPATGALCPAGFVCGGGASLPAACTAVGGSWCAPGTASNSPGVGGWQTCPVGRSCAGGSALALPVQPLQANSVVVVRIGDSSANYGPSTQPVFIDEFDGATNPMTLIQTIALPTLPSGAQQAFSLHPSPRGASGPSPGFLSLSADGRFLSLAGYAAPPLTPLSSLAGPNIPRVIARIDWLGNVDTTTTTVLGDNSAANAGTAFSILSACSFDGTGFVFTTDYDVADQQVSYQAFGTQVTSVAQIKSFSSPVALARSPNALSPFLGGAQPVVGAQDGWHQCQYVGGQLVLSHAWSSGTAGDLSAPNVAGAVTDANLGADFARRWTYSTAIKNAHGFAFFDNNQHLAICDRGNNILVVNDPSTSGLCAGSATNTSSTPVTPVAPTLSSPATVALTGIVDTTLSCFGVMSSRDGASVFFTTDTPNGFSRIFRMSGWVPGGGAGAPVTQWNPVNNWWLYTPPATSGTANPNVNLGGVANTFQNIFTNGQPIFKGIAQTAQLAPGAACPGGYALGGTSSCAICAAATYASAGMLACASCPGPVAVALSAGLATCTCPRDFASAGTSGASLVCTACPAGATALPGSSACTCPGAYAVWIAASNTCYTAPSSSPSPSGSPSLTATPSQTPSGTPTPTQTPTSSASFSPTPSNSPTASITPSTTQTPTPSTTVSMSASPTRSFSNTPSQTATPTGTQTPTPSQTASPTSIADSLLTFSFLLAPGGTASAGAVLPASAVYGQASVLTAIKTTYASLLGLSLAQVVITNITDVATGVTTNLLAMGLQRRAQSGGASGSKGLTIWMRANLGKAPSMSSLSNMQAALSGATPSAFAPVFAAIVAAGWATSASALSASVNVKTLTFANTAPVAPISAAAGAPAPSSSGDSSVPTGVAVGVVLLFVFVGIWSWRSWSKHGKLPCFRDRAAEKRAMLSATASRVTSSEEGDLTVRTLADQVALLKAELAAKKALEVAERNREHGGGGTGGASVTLSPFAEARAKAAAESAIAAGATRAHFTPVVAV